MDYSRSTGNLYPCSESGVYLGFLHTLSPILHTSPDLKVILYVAQAIDVYAVGVWRRRSESNRWIKVLQKLSSVVHWRT